MTNHDTERPRSPSELLVRDPAMREVFRRLDRVAPLDTTVLLTGESGTGKELAASWLHDKHPSRHAAPFVQVHCGAIPETLLESELFGHVRGAFTGAERDRVGRFEQADGGTLFLDEISTMSLPAQVRLLRVLQERTVTRVGGSETRAIDVRVVVASNQDLKELVERGLFRLDLYYRISTFRVTLPPLRDRRADVPALADLFGTRLAHRMRLPCSKRILPETMAALVDYSWPGNVRELENAIEHAYVLAEGPELGAEHLPEEIARCAGAPGTGSSICLTEEGLSFRTVVTNLERELILQSLQLAEGNKARAAELLHLKRTTFLEKLRRLQDEGLLEISQLERSNPPRETALVV